MLAVRCHSDWSLNQTAIMSHIVQDYKMAAGVEYWLAVCTVDARSGCWVADAGVPTLYDVSTVLVSVNDVNDNQPIITGPAPSASSSNNTTPSAIIELPPSVDVGHVVTHVTASDDDVGDNARLSYSIVGDVIGSAAELFAIDEQTGEVTVAAPLPHSSHTTLCSHAATHPCQHHDTG